METSFFIDLAYCVTGLLLGGLVLATWLRARAVKRQLNQHPDA